MIGLLLALLLQDPPATLTYLPPKDAKAPDVEKAAKAVEKRCVEYGYKGVTAKAVNGEVIVACETGITEAMTKRLEHFTVRACAKVEFMLLYPLEGPEGEQFAPGKAAPKGTTWIKRQDGKDALVINNTQANLTGRVAWKKATKAETRFDGSYTDGEAHFEFSEETSKVIKTQADALNRVHIVLTIDGREAKSSGVMSWKYGGAKKASTIALWKCEEAKDDLGGICLNNPLPFPLELKK